GDRAAIIVHPIGDYRPTVVDSRLNQVQFVASARTMFRRPDFIGDRMPVKPLRVSMAITPDARDGVVTVRERVVLRNPSVVVNSIDFAIGTRQILRHGIASSIADGEKQVAVPKRKATSEVVTGRKIILLRRFPNDLFI